MDDYRRFRQKNNDSSRQELFSGATIQGGYGYGYGQQGGYPPPPPPGNYPPPPPGDYGQSYYGQQQETEEDVEEIKSQIKSVKQDSVNSTQRSLQLIAEAEASGRQTLTKLGEQTQRINYTERQLDLAEAHSRRAAEQASKLKKVNGSMFGFDFSNPFTKKRREAEEMARVQALHEQQRDSRENMRLGNWESQQRINHVMKQGNKPQPGYTPGRSGNRSKFQFEADEEDEELENQVDDNLKKISDGLTILNAVAIASGEEVKKQNKVLDRISYKTDGLEGNILGTTHKLKKIG